ncbi:MAG: tRNA uridine-5-carboxymethylaminomethyl(34) synthesis enzyme MnmG [Planctomycetota bacterium]|jgi:tRNA uridine 5-carboxymethylaminomethyl modification enzyme|nr:tRNA uridine-5-carboxymethylaminomethyl(34) synthesis enzyme MnmG [Planctomycetota bacterium]
MQARSDDDPARTHPHPAPAAEGFGFDLIVVGGGHAGVEAALGAARLGARTALVTWRTDLIGEMSCNPAIGGLGKGQLVKEIDALGGVMGRAADETGIQFRMLNTRKGAAVRAPRCQSDRHRYRERVTAAVVGADGVELRGGAVEALLLAGESGAPRVAGVRLAGGEELRSPAVVLTTGTFLRAVMHTGDEVTEGGRVGERSSVGLGEQLAALGVATGRHKTGTPPRLDAASIDFEHLEPQLGDERPRPFSWATERAAFPRLEQVACHVTWTNPGTHERIRSNIHRAPMYAGRIDGVGPRYCPSVEDKVMRFADRDRHQVFLEPEGLESDVVYVNGVSTSLPAEVQEDFLRTIEGLERAAFLRHGYAVEYDFVLPGQLTDTLAVRSLPGLYLAGQINGTSGYEEAAGQGLLAGANAALWTQDRAPLVFGRHEAYLGVMVDDLVVRNPTEPYRMFTSRAEYRLLLRQDNADRRLTPTAATLGLAGPDQPAACEARSASIERATGLLAELRTAGGRSLADDLKRPEVRLAERVGDHPELAWLADDEELCEAVETEIKYAGYVRRQGEDVERLARRERTEIPADFDYAAISGLAGEAREKLARLRPVTLGVASRVDGVRPPDLALLAVHLERRRRDPQAAPRR